MISLTWVSSGEPESSDGQNHIKSLMRKFSELPRHIAKKHLQAAMKRALKPGVPALRANTPPLNTRRGRARKGEKRTTNALRKAATAVAKYKGRNANGYVTGILGYRYGTESRKAIWQEFGTSHGIIPKRMMEKTMQQVGPPAADVLAQEMAIALERAAAEIEAGMNPGYQG